jgi:hypothetical protein
MLKRIKARLAERALRLVLNRIQDFVVHDQPDSFDMLLVHAKCMHSVYEIEDGDWLECMVAQAFDHKCKGA